MGVTALVIYLLQRDPKKICVLLSCRFKHEWKLKAWENKTFCGNMSCRQSVSTALATPKLSWVFLYLNSNTENWCFLFFDNILYGKRQKSLFIVIIKTSMRNASTFCPCSVFLWSYKNTTFITHFLEVKWQNLILLSFSIFLSTGY